MRVAHVDASQPFGHHEGMSTVGGEVEVVGVLHLDPFAGSPVKLAKVTGGSRVALSPAEIFVSPCARNTGDNLALGCPRDRLED